MAIGRHGGARHRQRHGGGPPYAYAGLVILALVIVIGVAAVLLSAHVTNITSAQTLNVTNTGVVFRMAGVEYVAFLHGTAGATAYVYITRTPVFVNQVLRVELPEGTTVHVNYGTANADMALTLKSIGASAYVQMVPVDPGLGIAPDSEYITSLPPTSLEGSPPSGTTTIKINANGSNTTTIKTTVTAATTVPSVVAQVTTYLKATEYYPLMLNYSIAYAKTLKCGLSQYDADYISQYGVAPAGPTTYQNVSSVTPYNMSLSVAQYSGALYTATYSTTAKASVGTGPALVVTINSSDGSISSVKYEGVFSGLGYTQLYNAYATMAGIGDSCEAYFG